MVICYFNIIGVAVDKTEADTPLIVNRDCVLAFAVSLQGMEAVTWRYCQVLDTDRKVDIL
jgi:hypothetical protein